MKLFGRPTNGKPAEDPAIVEAAQVATLRKAIEVLDALKTRYNEEGEQDKAEFLDELMEDLTDIVAELDGEDEDGEEEGEDEDDE